MSKASALRKLSDEDLDKIHHAIRRDAMSDLEIARLMEKMLKKSGLDSRLRGNDNALSMVISRYRKSAAYRDWLRRWENQDVELKRQIETQKQRFEFLSNLVQSANGEGLKAVSQSLMARLLTMASELSDDELKSAAAGRQGWVVKVINAVTDDLKREQSAAVDKASEIAADKKLSPEESKRRIREIFEGKARPKDPAV